MSPRRQLTVAVLLCLLGSAVALFAATRTWGVEVTDRPGSLPDLREPRSGAAVLGWLPALGWVGLAGAGALLATRARPRRILGAVLLVAGGALAVGGLLGLVGVDRSAAGAAAAAWPVLCLAGGLCAAAGAVSAVRRGHTWPAMGARYERRGASASDAADRGPVGTRDAWEALDRGEDPTVR